MTRTRYIQIDGKLVPYERRTQRHTSIHTHKDFTSPIDGTVITSPQKLKEHNKRHGVTDARDYSKQYLENKATERVNRGQADLNKTRHQDVTRLVDTILRRRNQ